MTPDQLQVVADIGNSRLKIAFLSVAGEPEDPLILDVHTPESWSTALEVNGYAQHCITWTIGSVNPPAADRLRECLRTLSVQRVHWIRSASDVSVRHKLATPATTGADRALAVLATQALRPVGEAVHVVLCGTAITVECCDSHGTWLGGAILPGLSSMARSLMDNTAQLPMIDPLMKAHQAFGNCTETALAAGLYWGLVGATRECLLQQSAFLGAPSCHTIWGGGDAHWIAREVEGPSARVEPFLVLRGLAALAREHTHA
jgi:type III pantothenate kinase